MALKLINKKNVGILLSLFLLIVLSVFKGFHFLTETYLGRIVLLLFITGIAYSHKVLGLLAVLFVIIAFNHHTNIVQSYNYFDTYSYFEGFDGSGNVVDASGNITDTSGNSVVSTILQDKVNILKAKENILQNQLNAAQQRRNQIDNTTTTTTSSASTTQGFRTREGFALTEQETNILRGKPSNAIPVYKNKNNDEDVSPSDSYVFKEQHSRF